jgi:hypothetical protein
VVNENASYDVRLFFPDGTVMTPDQYPYLANIIPSQVGHLVTVYKGQQVDLQDHPVVNPAEFRLDAAYPNPFNAQTTIHYSVARASHVQIDIFNINGQRVTSLINADQTTGVHSVSWNAVDLPSGVYIYRLQTDGRALSQKMVLLK